MVSPCFAVADNMRIVPKKPSVILGKMAKKPGPDGSRTAAGETISCNVASCVKIVTREQATDSRMAVNCTMKIESVPVMRAYKERASEAIANVPVIILSEEVKQGVEIVCVASEDPFA